MNEKIISLAQQCGIVVHFSSKTGRDEYSCVSCSVPALERFALAIEDKVREECLAEVEDGIWIDKSVDEILESIADAIRPQ